MASVDAESPQVDGAEPAYEVCVEGRWQPSTLHALAELAFDGVVSPQTLVRPAPNGAPHPASRLCNPLYHSMLNRYFEWVGKLLIEQGCFPAAPGRREVGLIQSGRWEDRVNSLEKLIADGRRLRGWAEVDEPPSPDPATAETEAAQPHAQPSGNAATVWFRCHLEFVEAVLWELLEAPARARKLYAAILRQHPETIGWQLWFCAKHQLSCAQITSGESIGIAGLCYLIELGTGNGEFRSGPTDYAFSELLRYFETHGRPHRLLDNTLRRPAVRRLWQGDRASADPNAPFNWRVAYPAARQAFQERAKRLGLGDSRDLSVMWPELRPPWQAGQKPETTETEEAARHVLCGVLTVLGAQDIQKDFAAVDPTLRAKRQRLQGHMDKAAELAHGGQLAEAGAVLAEVIRQARQWERDDESFATLGATARQELDELNSKLEEREQREQAALEREILDRLKKVQAIEPEDAEAALDPMLTDPQAKPWAHAIRAARAAAVKRRRQRDRARLLELEGEFNRHLQDGRFREAELVLITMAAAARDKRRYVELGRRLRRRKAEVAFAQGLEDLMERPDQAEAYLTAAARSDPELARWAPPLILACRLLQHDAAFSGLVNLQAYRSELRQRVAELIELWPRQQRWPGERPWRSGRSRRPRAGRSAAPPRAAPAERHESAQPHQGGPGDAHPRDERRGRAAAAWGWIKGLFRGLAAFGSRMWHRAAGRPEAGDESAHGPTSPQAPGPDRGGESAAFQSRRAARGAEDSGGSAAVNRIWRLVMKFTKDVTSSGEVDDAAVAQLVDSICSHPERYRRIPQAIDRALRLLDLIEREVPKQAMFCSAASTARWNLELQRKLGEAEVLRMEASQLARRPRPTDSSGDEAEAPQKPRPTAESKLTAAMRRFGEVIHQDPEMIEAWKGFAEAKLQREEPRVSRRRKLQWLQAILDEIAGEDRRDARERNSHDPEAEIDRILVGLRQGPAAPGQPPSPGTEEG